MNSLVAHVALSADLNAIRLLWFVGSSSHGKATRLHARICSDFVLNCSDTSVQGECAAIIK